MTNLTRFVCGGLTAMAVAGLMSSASAQSETVLLNFGGKAGTNPADNGNLLTLANGDIIGTAGAGEYGLVFEALHATKKLPWREKVIYRFKGDPDGAAPNGLTQGNNGVLYGVTRDGGNGPGGPDGYGVVYSLTPPAATGDDWTESIIYTFPTNTPGGVQPINAQLVFDQTSGSLFGTTPIGGSTGKGVLYRLDPPTSGNTWTETVLHTFGSSQYDGAQPNGIMAYDAAATTLYGMSQNSGPYNFGTFWSYNTTSNTFTTLYYFQGGSDGATPIGGLLGPFRLNTSGDQFLLGTTSAGGGSTNCSGGCGMVFAIDLPQPLGEFHLTVLHTFQGYQESDGATPKAGLVDIGGTAYGTAEIGGTKTSFCQSGCGMLFGIEMSGLRQTLLTYGSLYNFAGPPGDGAYPWTGVTGDSAGNVYGVTDDGGSKGRGVMFEYTP